MNRPGASPPDGVSFTVTRDQVRKALADARHRAKYFEHARDLLGDYRERYGSAANVGQSLCLPIRPDSALAAEGWIQASWGRLYLRPTDRPQDDGTGWQDGVYVPDKWAIEVSPSESWNDVFGRVLLLGIRAMELYTDLSEKADYFDMYEGVIPDGALVSFPSEPVFILPDLTGSEEPPDPWKGDEPDERLRDKVTPAEYKNMMQTRDLLLQNPEVKTQTDFEDAGGKKGWIKRGPQDAYRRITGDQLPPHYTGGIAPLKRLIEDLWRLELKKTSGDNTKT